MTSDQVTLILEQIKSATSQLATKADIAALQAETKDLREDLSNHLDDHKQTRKTIKKIKLMVTGAILAAAIPWLIQMIPILF